MVQNINYKKKYLKYKLKYEKMCNQKGGMWLLGFSQEDHMGSHESENAWAKEQEHTSNKAATNIQRVLRGFLDREIIKFSKGFNLTYDEAVTILSNQQLFINFLITINIDGFPNFFRYLVNDSGINVVEFLLRSGLDVNNTVNAAGCTPLHVAASYGVNKLLNILIRYGADVNKQCNNNSTPLMYAVENDNYDSIQILLENGANIDLADIDGNTALHYATVNSSFETVRYLISSGADINLVNNNGNTVLGIAQFLGRTDVEKYIKTLGDA